MKEEALLIASRLDTVRVLNNSKSQESVLSQAQAMIRRLVEKIDSQENHLKLKDDFIATLIKPLSDEEIQVLINNVPDYDIGIYELFEFARAIEERHGIKWFFGLTLKLVAVATY